MSDFQDLIAAFKDINVHALFVILVYCQGYTVLLSRLCHHCQYPPCSYIMLTYLLCQLISFTLCHPVSESDLFISAMEHPANMSFCHLSGQHISSI